MDQKQLAIALTEAGRNINHFGFRYCRITTLYKCLKFPMQYRGSWLGLLLLEANLANQYFALVDDQYSETPEAMIPPNEIARGLLGIAEAIEFQINLELGRGIPIEEIIRKLYNEEYFDSFANESNIRNITQERRGN